jgi:putative YphP/YqiW family bacilliredoxin
MYPPELVAPMRAELDQVGFQQTTNAEAVDQAIATPGTVFMRPGVKKSLLNTDKLPGTLVSAFAGVDQDAVARARQYMLPYPPSSPCVALFKDGKLMHMVERHHIEGRTADMIAEHLKMVYQEFC